jgi:tetratricopeptide (TPR) repeat protein
LASAILLLGISGFAQDPPAESSARLLPGLGTHHHPISTKSPEAQKFFDQGLILAFGFNRPEAARSFRRAAELDPDAPMPYWGLALALGRHLNMETDLDVDAAGAYQAIQKALALGASESGSASAYERAYIEALARRCSPAANPDWEKVDRDYSQAMAALARRYPDDMDAATLYADSVMNVRRYRWYDADGTPAEGTQEAQNALEAVLRRMPDHPFANHLFIHLLDTSPHPEFALPSAGRLAHFAPGMGHLVHMPTHIYLSLGDYDAAARLNEQAAEADRDYMKLTGVSMNVYIIGYYFHNLHMATRAHAEQGRFADARRAAELLVSQVAGGADDMPAMTDYYTPNLLFVLLRFSRWDDVLRTPPPNAKMPTTTALWHFARAIAFQAKGQRQEASAEKAAFYSAQKRVPANWMWQFNRAENITRLAATILEAKFAADRRTAIERWRAAVELQDHLAYDEPPPWYYPVRESLGAALLQDGQAAEAERLFRADLARHPRNPRALFGLWRSLLAQGQTDGARWVRLEFESAWQRADTELRLEDLN